MISKGNHLKLMTKAVSLYICHRLLSFSNWISISCFPFLTWKYSSPFNNWMHMTLYIIYMMIIFILIFAIFLLKVLSCTYIVFYIRHCVYITCIYANLQLRIPFSYSYIYSLDILSFFDWKFLEITNFICIQIKNIFHLFHFPSPN